MPTYQFGRQTDIKLNNLAKRIFTDTKQIEEAQTDFNTAWEEVLALFNEFAREDSSQARFIASTGETLVRGTRAGSTKLDEQKLFELLVTSYGAPKAARIWKTITVSKVDSRLLEIAVQDHKIDAGIVQECVSTGPSSDIRNHNEWTKEDKERAVIFGIEKDVEIE